MTDNKKNGEAQATPKKPTVSSTTSKNTETKEKKKTCPALYPSEPYTSNK